MRMLRNCLREASCHALYVRHRPSDLKSCQSACRLIWLLPAAGTASVPPNMSLVWLLLAGALLSCCLTSDTPWGEDTRAPELLGGNTGKHCCW
jgi:hypothetical protein